MFLIHSSLYPPRIRTSACRRLNRNPNARLVLLLRLLLPSQCWASGRFRSWHRCLPRGGEGERKRKDAVLCVWVCEDRAKLFLSLIPVTSAHLPDNLHWYKMHAGRMEQEQPPAKNNSCCNSLACEPLAADAMLSYSFALPGSVLYALCREECWVHV